jgi:Ser/Thr protein kinase RdoA (MazF antagonist)
MLTREQIGQLIKQTDFGIELIKQHNHLYRLQFEGITAYVKLYTKDWYRGDIAGTGFCVDHEITAWRTLAERGLSVPAVVLADVTTDNALQRPFLITQALQGESLTALLRQAQADEFNQLLQVTGRYISTMHSIQFDYPGYITSAGLSKAPDPDAWQHPVWTFGAFEREAKQSFQMDRQTLPTSLLDEVEVFYNQHAADLAQSYAQPRFVHGDCHAEQFFLYGTDEGWKVSGVVDMEVASAGDCGADFLKFGIEMAALFPADTFWWQPLFEGYGHEPSFDLIKLRMLVAQHHNYSWIWSGTRKAIVRHVLMAKDWYALYDLAGLQVETPSTA